MLGSPGLEGLDAAAVDRLKRQFYERIEALGAKETAASLDAATRNLVEDIFRVAPSPTEVREIRKYAAIVRCAAPRTARSCSSSASARTSISMPARGTSICCSPKTEGWPARGLHEVLVNYLGFPFWDVLTFPVLPWREAGEFNEIRVDRISAQDAGGIERLGDISPEGHRLQPICRVSVARLSRERLPAWAACTRFDRLIDIVCDAAGTEAVTQRCRGGAEKARFLTDPRYRGTAPAHMRPT